MKRIRGSKYKKSKNSRIRNIHTSVSIDGDSVYVYCDDGNLLSHIHVHNEKFYYLDYKTTVHRGQYSGKVLGVYRYAEW